jgi:hypothetical protein
MVQLLENNLPVVESDGLNTNKNVTFGGTLAVTGAVTITGALAVTGAITGPRVSNIINSATVGATVVLTTAQSGSKCINVSTSGSPSWTLPVGVAGTEFTFICGNTTAGFTVTNATQVIHFKTSASGTVLTSTTTLTNTQATAIVGDFIALVCDGTAWWMMAISGIFAAS